MPWCKNGVEIWGVFCFMNYRKLYEKYFGIKIPPEFDIHHIDFNHENNNIENLILLPKSLHQRIHKSFLFNGGTNTQDLFKYGCCANQLWDSILSQSLMEAAQIYKDLQFWAACREMEMLQATGQGGPMFFSYNDFRK